jgi:acyl carrier protein
MNKSEIKDCLTPIFQNVFREADLIIHEDMTANDVVGWTSLTHMEMISQTEKTFGIKFKLKDLTKLQQQNVGGFIALIERYLSER